MPKIDCILLYGRGVGLRLHKVIWENFGIPVLDATHVEKAPQFISSSLAVVATPPEQHLQTLLVAIQTSPMIICEKPCGASAADCLSIIKLVENSAASVLINYQLRFHAQTVNIIRSMAQSNNRLTLLYRSTAYSNGPARPWYTDERQGGTAIFSIGSHIIDLICQIVGPVVPKFLIKTGYSKVEFAVTSMIGRDIYVDINLSSEETCFVIGDGAQYVPLIKFGDNLSTAASDGIWRSAYMGFAHYILSGDSPSGLAPATIYDAHMVHSCIYNLFRSGAGNATSG